MTVGKTTIAQILAERLKIKWVDLDKLIETEAKLSVNEIFKGKGEIYFRKVENDIFQNLVRNDERLVISTGGGTPCYANNHLFLNGNDVVSVYLKASGEVILERLKKGRNTRPLVAHQTEEELKEFVNKHLFERSYFYNQATYKIDIDGKSPELIVEEILQLLN